MKALATAVAVVGFAATLDSANSSAQESASSEKATTCEFCNFAGSPAGSCAHLSCSLHGFSTCRRVSQPGHPHQG